MCTSTGVSLYCQRMRKILVFCNFFLKTFGGYGYFVYLCTRFQTNGSSQITLVMRLKRKSSLKRLHRQRSSTRSVHIL